MRSKKTNLILLFLIAFVFLFSACSKQKTQVSHDQTDGARIKKQEDPKSNNVYKIAVIAPQIGPYQALGLSIIRGAELAVSTKNENGGIDGKEIKLITVDDGGLPGDATWRARDLVDAMVLGVIGHLNSDISIPASEIYAKAKIPQISPGSTSPLFTERDAVKGYVFRTIGRDDKQGRISADIVQEKGFQKVGVLYNNRPYGLSLASEFVKKLDKKTTGKEIDIVLYEKYRVGKSDYSQEIKVISEKTPEVIFFIGEYGDAGRFLKELRGAGLATAFIGSEGVFDQEFIDYDNETAQGAFVISSLPVQDKIFPAKYKEKFGKELGSYSASAYDATNILISAIEKVKEKNPEKIAQEIQNIHEFNGVLGNLSFNSKGDLEGPGFAVYEVEDGMFVLKN